jgi:hypothetical protein
MHRRKASNAEEVLLVMRTGARVDLNVVATEVGVAVDGFFSKPYHVTQLLGHVMTLCPRNRE